MKQTDDPTKDSKRTEAHRRVTREVQTQLTQTNMMVPQGEVKPSTLNTEHKTWRDVDMTTCRQ